MKKNVKYIGSAIAVALLAAGAPVVIPEIISSGVVAAATYNPSTLYGDIQGDSIVNSDDNFTKAYFTAFKNQFENQYVSDSSGLEAVLNSKKDYVPGGSMARPDFTFSYLDPENPAKFKDFQDDRSIELLNSRSGRAEFDNNFSTEYDSKYYFRDILVSMEVVDGNGNPVKLQNSDDYQTAIGNFENGSIPFPLTFHVELATDKNETRYTPNTLDRLNQMDPSLTSFEFKLYQSQFNINKKNVSTRVGTSISDFDGTGNDLSIVDKSTEDSSDSKERTPIFGKSLFKKSSDAISYAESSDFSPDATDQGETGLISSDGTVSEPGEYYQTISYKLENDTNDDAAISAMLSGENDPNTNQPVPVYKTTINGNESTENEDFVINKSKGLLTITRLVSVSEDDRPEVVKNISTADADFNSSAKSEEDSERENNTNTLNDKNGNSLINDSDANKGITFGDNYYSEDTDPSKVLNNDKDSSINVTDSNGNFIQSGNYLRTITFHLIAGSVDTNKFGTEENKDYVLNTDNNTVTYIQKVHIGDPTQKIDVTVNIPDVNTTFRNPVDTDDSKLKVINKVNGETVNTAVKIGTTYYNTAENALEKSNPNTVTAEGIYSSIGTKYRTVTYTLPKNVSYYTLPKTKNDVGYTTDGNTVTYVQKVKINRMIATVTVDPLKIPLGTSINDSSVSNENIGLSIKANNKELNHTNPVITFISDNTGYNTNNYFVNKENALDGSPSSTNIIENGKFVHSGTYYRVVRITNTIMPGAYNYQLESDSDNMKVIPGGTRYYYYAQPVIVSEPKETSENINALTVIAGTPSDGASIDGTKLNDSTIYDIKDVSDSGNPNSIVSNVTIGDYYEKENDALEGDKSKTADTTKGLTKSTYYRTITFKLNEGDGYKYSFPNAEKIDAENDEVTYIQKITVDPIVAKVDSATVPEITIKDPISKLPDSSNYALKMKDDTPIHAEVESDTVYEDSNLNTPVKSDTFDKAKTYYRAITFKPTDLSAESYKFNDPNITKNSDGTITYVQPITVNKKSTANWTDDSNKGNNIQNLNVDVTVGDDDSALSNTEGYDLTDAASKSLVDKENNNGILFSPEYYNINSDGTAGEKSDYASGYKIMRPGTYYRQVTFSLLAGVPEDYDFSKLPGYVSSDDNSVTVDQKITATALTPSDDIKDASTTTGTSSTSKSVENPADIALTGKDNASLIKSDPTFDGFYDKDGNKLSDVVDKNGNFTKAGTYYQKVTVPLTDNADYAYDFDSLNGTVNHDAENPTVTFMRTITVNQHHSSGSSTNTNSEDEWTYYQDAGVVTTKTTEPTYSLNNHANETIQNRALSGDSSWVTDQYRVNNRTGVKQYRVATGEWIDANDVYFRDNGNNTEDEWTYYKDPGVVLTKETQEYYSLNNHANETIQNRALSEDSGWITDQYRVNNRTGVKQYRVATGEWIDSHDVIFVKDVQMIVNVDETKDYYNLHDIQKNANSNRALEKKTSWFTDKVAIDYDGSTYYRVATNEWVKQENGVHLDTSVWYKN
ncbi:hypothetical protein [Companilactobacillus futsaii]|uniref:hypothetical protein n=1 Tax=Companilactobacillus futsaii TaxID=938155 RepID=UPI0018A0E628|nr:hypothetical protein [Companilactobacillus futsaii]